MRPDLLELAVFAAFMAPVTFFDLRERRIPDVFVALAGVALLDIRLWQGTLLPGHVFGALAAFGLFFLLWLGAREKIGLGDAKLAALIGFYLGFPGWLVAVFVASLAGVIFVLLRRAAGGKSLFESLAFGPFLVLGTLAAFFVLPYGERLLGAAVNL